VLWKRGICRVRSEREEYLECAVKERNMSSALWKRRVSRVCCERVEYLECAVKERNISSVLWKRGVSRVCCEREEYLECAVKERSISSVLWKRGVSRVYCEREEYLECPVKERSISSVLWKRGISRVCCESSTISVVPATRVSELLVSRNEYRCVSEIQEVKCSKLNCTANFLTLWTLCEPCSHRRSTERENLRNSYRLSQLVAWIRMRFSDKQQMYVKTAVHFLSNLVQFLYPF